MKPYFSMANHSISWWNKLYRWTQARPIPTTAEPFSQFGGLVVGMAVPAFGWCLQPVFESRSWFTFLFLFPLFHKGNAFPFHSPFFAFVFFLVQNLFFCLYLLQPRCQHFKCTSRPRIATAISTAGSNVLNWPNHLTNMSSWFVSLGLYIYWNTADEIIE